MERKAKIAKAIRIISVPPVMVTMLILILVFYKAEIFRSFSESMILIILLGIMPVSAYGLQLILPNYKKSGREGQRKLAFITSLIGYSAAFIWAIFTDVKDSLLLIVRRHIVGGINRTLFSADLPPRLCRTGTCRRLQTE